MTSRNGVGHARRRSRAVSHRSQASIGSDGGIRGYDDDDDDDGPTDDSGIGTEYHSGQHHVSLPPPDYHLPADTYQDDIAGYTEDYYQHRHSRS